MFQNGQKVVVVSTGDERRVIKVQSASGTPDPSRYPVVTTDGVTGRDQQVQVVSGGDATRFPILRGVSASARDTADSVITALTPAAWYRNATGVTSAGGFASQWDDYSGNGRHLVQATGTNQPAYDSGTGVLTFDGADNFMKVDFTMNQPFTVALRVTPVSWTDQDRFFDGATANNNYVYQTTATPRIVQRGSAVGAASAAGTPSLSAKHSLIFVFNGASGVMNIDGTEQASNAGTNNATGWTLACNGARIGTEASSIVVYEAVLFTSALDATQRSNLKTALDLI